MIAIVVSEFNQNITDTLLQGCQNELNENGITDKQILITKVPGAVEIPLAAQWLAQTGKHEAIIALGAVIYGETDHYHYVCNQVNNGCQRVMLDFSIPVIFGVLTTKTIAQAVDRIGGKKGHLGKESAQAAIKMLKVKQQLMLEP